jgi:2-oxoglutarate ferredoxin oxidoreductase subunit delta
MTQQVVRQGCVLIRADRCKSCGWCVRHCPHGVLRIGAATNPRGYHPCEVADPDACTGCAQCALVCPDVCIEVYRARKAR